MKYKFLDHTADIKFQAYGETLNEVFENSALAVAEYLNSGEKITPSKAKIIDISAQDNESLLSNFIDEILYLIDAEDFVTSKAQIQIRGNNLHAELFGDKSSNYNLQHIKAATYAEMYIKKVNSKEKGKSHWECQMVLDV